MRIQLSFSVVLGLIMKVLPVTRHSPCGDGRIT